MTEEKKLMERRRFLRNAATVAWATPVIMTLGASGAQAQAVSCVKPGAACGSGSPTPTNPCCDTTGLYCCCQETKTSGGKTTVTKTCILATDCRSSGTAFQRECVVGL